MTTSMIIGIIGCALSLVLIFARVWVGPSLMIISIVCIALMKDWGYAMSVLSPLPYSQMSSYTWACIPLFILMGCTLSNTGIGQDLYKFARNMLGTIRGGLAMATILACSLFSAICGDSVANAVTMGRVALPEMKRYHYDEKLAACAVVSGGTIGIMIPPSVAFIMYAMITEQSVGKLFAAGMLPGITQALFYFATIAIICRIKPSAGGERVKFSRSEKIKSIGPVWPVAVLFIVMMGGLYGGFFTPVEAGAFGAVFTFVLALAMRRITRQSFFAFIKEGVTSASMVLFLIVGAYFFTRLIAISGISSALQDMLIGWQVNYHVPRILVVIVIMSFYLITGAFLDALAVILLTLGIVFPVITGLGYDPIWWGVIMVRMLEMCMITPPFGLNLFCVSRTCDVPIKSMFVGIYPFVIADVVHIAILVALPELSLWLPRLMGLM